MESVREEDMSAQNFTVRAQRRWGLRSEELGKMVLPATPDPGLTPEELDDLILLFRSFGRLEPGAFRPRRGTFEALLVFPAGADLGGFSDLRLDQLLHLLSPYDEDARFLQSQKEGNSDLLARWIAFPESLEAKLPSALDSSKSWLAEALRCLRIGAENSPQREQGLDAFSEALAGKIVAELQGIAQGEDAGISVEEPLLASYSPLLLWGTHEHFLPIARALVSPGWDVSHALMGAMVEGAGPPIESGGVALVDRLRSVLPIAPADGRPRVLAAALALERRRGRTLPRLLDIDVHENEGAIWSWLDILALAATTNLREAVQELLVQDQNWLEFEAIGEGELPLHLYRAARVHGLSPSACRELFAPHLGDAEDWFQENEAEDWSWISAYPYPLDLWEEAAGRTERGLLHEGIDEAFGDVFSPHDPFSVRKREP